MKLSSLVCLVVGISFAQTKVDVSRQGKTADFGVFPHTRPAQVGTALPSSCQPGELFFNSSAPAGQNLYGCAGSPPNWVLESAATASLTGATVGGVLVVVDAGSANAYAGCPTPAAALTDGVLVSLRTANANTGPATFSLCSSPPRAIVNQTGAALAAGAIAGAGVSAPAGPLLMYNANTATFALLTPALSGVPYSGANQNLDLGNNSLHAASVSTGDGTVSAALILPELAANGLNDTRIYGADNQPSSGCIVWPSGPSATGQVAMDSGSSVTTTDGLTCRLFTWQTPGGGGGGGAIPSGVKGQVLGYNTTPAYQDYSPVNGRVTRKWLPSGDNNISYQDGFGVFGFGTNSATATQEAASSANPQHGLAVALAISGGASHYVYSVIGGSAVGAGGNNYVAGQHNRLGGLFTHAGTSGVRFWFGWSTTPLSLVGVNNPTIPVNAFRYSTAAGDSHYMCYSADGAAADTPSDSGVSPSTTAPDALEVNENNGSPQWFINQVRVCAGFSAGHPIFPGTAIQPSIAFDNPDAGAHTIHLGPLAIVSDY